MHWCISKTMLCTTDKRRIVASAGGRAWQHLRCNTATSYRWNRWSSSCAAAHDAQLVSGTNSALTCASFRLLTTAAKANVVTAGTWTLKRSVQPCMSCQRSVCRFGRTRKSPYVTCGCGRRQKYYVIGSAIDFRAPLLNTLRSVLVYVRTHYSA